MVNPQPCRAFRRPEPAYDSFVLQDLSWRARTARVFSGALKLWGAEGAVGLDPEDANGFLIAPSTGATIRVRHRPDAGWVVTVRDPASGATVELGRHPGLPGLLRRLREVLAPEAPAGRLVIGAQPFLGRDTDAP